METAQFTYFQEVGGIPVKPVMGEITYGLERLALFVQNRDDIHAIDWNGRLTYGDLHRQNEQEQSRYQLRTHRPRLQQRHFTDHETECHRLIEAGLPLPAYDAVINAPTPSTYWTPAASSPPPNASPTSAASVVSPVSSPPSTVKPAKPKGFPLRPPSS